MSHYRWGCIQKNIICLPECGLRSTGASWHGSQRPAARGWLWEGWQHPGSPEPASGSACCPGWPGALLWSPQHPRSSRDSDPRARAAEPALLGSEGQGQSWQSLAMEGFYDLHDVCASLLSAVLKAQLFLWLNIPKLWGNSP